jgi:hypothetical protein
MARRSGSRDTGSLHFPLPKSQARQGEFSKNQGPANAFFTWALQQIVAGRTIALKRQRDAST